MSIKKIGPFLQKNSTAVDLINSPVVKLVDPSIVDIQRVRQLAGPNTWIIVRFYFESQPLTDPIGEAQVWCRRADPYLQAELDERVVFEGYNEISDADTEANAVFEQYRQNFLHTFKRGGVYGNHGVGNLTKQKEKPYKRLVENFSPLDFWGWHSYWGVADTVSNPWHTTRWQVLDLLKNVPAFLTEAGRDYVKDDNIARASWGARGWRKGKVSEDAYLQEIIHMGAILMNFPFIAGAALFLVGPCERQWDAYQSEGIYAKIQTLRKQSAPWFYQWYYTPSPSPEEPPASVPGPDPNDIVTELSSIIRDMQAVVSRMNALVGRVKG